MDQIEDGDLVYKGPWVRSAQQRLFQTLETEYAFPRATCRSLVNLLRNYLNETFGEKLHEGRITFHAASSSEPPGKKVLEIKTVPVHLTLLEAESEFSSIKRIFGESVRATFTEGMFNEVRCWLKLCSDLKFLN